MSKNLAKMGFKFRLVYGRRRRRALKLFGRCASSLYNFNATY
jgi:hypothetical protein